MLSRLYDAYLYPPDIPRPDFLAPRGEAALVPATSVSWRVFSNPVTLFVGGILAVILELALPKVRHGVWDHSTFRTAPKLRLQRTGLAAMVTIYGPASAARRMIGAVNEAHGRVRGTTDSGDAYAATDEPLLTWVHATAAFGFAEAYSRLAQPLGPRHWDAVFAEGVPVARAYGALTAPNDKSDWEDLLGGTAPALEGSETLDAFLAIMATTPVLPPLVRTMQAPLVRVAAGLVPPAAGLSFPAWRPGRADWVIARAGARAASHVRVATSPPVLACRRLGLEPKAVLSGPLPSPGRFDAPYSP